MSQINKQPVSIQKSLKRFLPTVQKPGRYTGGELNQVLKEWTSVETHVALVFPEIYDIGVPNLGIAILYDEINQREDALAERGYAPWIDMEAHLRENNLPLFSLENKYPLRDFDIIGFSLPYETLYTNVLNVLDLSGIPIHSTDRTNEHPLIISGGHACFNPEPMHEFIDAFIIGEGEEVIHDVINCFQSWKQLNGNRSELLYALSAIPGVYVPSLYQVTYLSDGRVEKITPMDDRIPKTILKRIVATLPESTTNLIVPNIDVVHNRVAIEIMRGCTRGCRFCHAGMITRPVRERSVEDVLRAIETALEKTGFEEIALLSLSSSDYRHINDLVDAITEKFVGKHLVISVPSLRIESFSVELMDKLKGSRLGGFTLAPEAASERMRKIINKPVSTEQLLDTAREVYAHGWTSIKLYFMIGHPSETIEDVQAIVDLCKEVLYIGKSVIGGRAKVHAGIGTFVPKPHTPFQWAACDTAAQVKEKQELLRSSLKHPSLKVSWTDPRETHMEAWLTRGDRRMSSVIETAWKNGAKFEAWNDHFRYDIWMDAFKQNGLDPDFYTHRQRDLDEVFPWDHIDTAVRDDYLKQEFTWSQKGWLREDCRDQCHACGILPIFNNVADDDWFCPVPEKSEQESAA